MDETKFQILSLTKFTDAEAQGVMGSYTCDACYRVRYIDSDSQTMFVLERVALDTPVVRKYDHFDEETLLRYAQVCQAGFSFGAYEGETLVGLLIAEKQDWNHSLWVWEFHVAPAYRGQGLGRALMDEATHKAKEADLRLVVCETQNRNAPAIQVYRRLGFQLEGINISYYSNTDFPDGDVAVFMKRRLG
jgi:ribosomal protein S18 acetylase RimI-like enzyme